jgi:hypothetical protein
MKNSFIPPAASAADSERCPYLGLHDDSSTSLAYPSLWNYCHCAVPPGPVSVPHQISTCLSREHGRCKVYVSLEARPLPRDVRGAVPSGIKRKPLAGIRGLFLFFVILGALIFLYAGLRLQEGGRPNGPSLEAPTSVLPASPFVTPEVLSLPASEAAATDDPLGTDASRRLCGHALDIPFGSDVQFVIHRVARGENMAMYVERFKTSIDAIVGINHNIRMPLWENSVVVIPVDTTLFVGLPPFEVYEQHEVTIPLEEFIGQLDTDPQAFRRFNAFDDSCGMFAGWILIPRVREAP